MRHSEFELEAAAGQHHRAGAQRHGSPAVARDDALHRPILDDQRRGRRAVADLDPLARRPRGQRLDEARPAARGLDMRAAPELESPVHLERLAAVGRQEAHALGAHPHAGLARPRDHDLDQLRVASELRHPRHVVEEIVGGVAAEIGGLDLGRAEVRDDRLELVEPIIGNAIEPGGEARIAAGLLLRRGLQHQHPLRPLARRQPGAEGGVAGAHHDHVRIAFHHPAVSRRPRRAAGA